MNWKSSLLSGTEEYSQIAPYLLKNTRISVIGNNMLDITTPDTPKSSLKKNKPARKITRIAPPVD